MEEHGLVIGTGDVTKQMKETFFGDLREIIGSFKNTIAR